MSADAPIEVARQANDWWMSAPFETVRELLLASEGYEDAVERFKRAGLEPGDLIGPDIEVVIDAFPGGVTLIGQRGRDGWIHFWREWVEPWEDLYLEASNYEEIGEHVLVDMRVVARGRGSGTPVDASVVQLFRVQEGAITLYGVYRTREEARAAIEAD
jgi:SnoaL-like protein